MDYLKNWFSNMIDIRKTIEGTFIDNMMKIIKPIYVHPEGQESIGVYTVEHYYQAMKMKNPFDMIRVAMINSPYQAKRIANTLERVDNWEDIKIDVMRTALEQKFVIGTYWYDRLMETEDEEIVETNNWHDNFWGNCICNRCNRIKGKNVLGKLLMEIRYD
jgi:ribA/ribD-fused uncharacterized protein